MLDVDPGRILFTRLSYRSAILIPLLALYVILTFVLLFQAVIPSFEDDTTSWTFATDSTVYTYFAESLREGRNDPWVLASLSFFPNTLWTPVLISLALNSALLIMLLNYSIFSISIALLTRSFQISTGTLVLLLLINPTTTTSILCVNKEILDLLSISLFLYARRQHRIGILLIALTLALLNRYEIFLVLLAFMACEGRANPFRDKRWTTLFFVLLCLNFIMPLWGAKALAHRFEEAEFAGLIKTLDSMQMNYMYILAVAPKIAEDLFGQLLNPQVWTNSSSWLYINFFNNLAYLVLILINAFKRRLSIQSDLIYLSVLGSIIVAQALVVQPRYFYFVYILLCLEVSAIDGNVSLTERRHYGQRKPIYA
jgi:hypothetical protein